MLHVVLYNPEIPQNTGNIMRSCVGFNAKLHLIKPLGFSMDDKYLKRSHLDYLPYLDYEIHENYEEFINGRDGYFFFLTRYGHKNPKEIDFSLYKDKDIYLIFGKESTGIPYDILASHLDTCFRIPTTDKIRSLNLSNCVAIMLYEVSEDMDYEGLINHEPDSLKGEFFIDQFIKE